MSVETGRFIRHLGAVEVQKETLARNRPSGVTSTAGMRVARTSVQMRRELNCLQQKKSRKVA